MKYTAIRKHEFQSGHRVYKHEGKCQYLHGHSYVATIHCKADKTPLNSLGMVIDFSLIKDIICTWIDHKFDHKFLIWEVDPMAKSLQEIDSTVAIVPFNPTAENIACYILEEGNKLLKKFQDDKHGVIIHKVEVKETGKCSAEAINE